MAIWKGAIFGGKGGASSFNKGAFGSIAVAEPRPLVALRFNYATHTGLYTDQSANSGSFSVGSGLATVDSGTETNGKGEMASVQTGAYTPGQGIICRFAGFFSAGVANNSRFAGFGDGTDGFYFGYNGTDFGICRQRGGSNTWIPQSSWSEDTMDGKGPSGVTLDQTKGNVYQVQFQWLGFGMVKFFIENPSTGELALVHKIEYANANTSPSILNPTLPLLLSSENNGSSTSSTIKVSSMSLLAEGPEYHNEQTFAEDNTKNLSTTETSIITFRNKSTYRSLTNRIQVRPMLVTMSADGTKPVTIRAYVNATLGGTPSYSDIDANNSVIEFDIAGTTVSGGTKIGTFRLDKTDSLTLDVSPFKFVIQPGMTITFTGTSSVSSDIASGMTWQELF